MIVRRNTYQWYFCLLLLLFFFYFFFASSCFISNVLSIEKENAMDSWIHRHQYRPSTYTCQLKTYYERFFNQFNSFLSWALLFTHLMMVKIFLRSSCSSYSCWCRFSYAFFRIRPKKSVNTQVLGVRQSDQTQPNSRMTFLLAAHICI